MANQNNDSLERFEELQLAALLFGLSDEERRELETLQSQLPAGPSHVAEAIGGIDFVCSTGASMDLPERLRSKIASDALVHLSSNQSPPPNSATRLSSWRQTLLPWSIALAASLLLLASFFGGKLLEPKAPTASEARAKLLSTAADIVLVTWAPGTTPVPNASGDVAWSPTDQQGYMRFVNLPVNDPTREQYQLWVFDRNQDQKTPVDGGVFDITNASETIVPFRPKLLSKNVYLFAITIEKPGGVVVSDRSRLPLLANVP